MRVMSWHEAGVRMMYLVQQRWVDQPSGDSGRQGRRLMRTSEKQDWPNSADGSAGEVDLAYDMRPPFDARLRSATKGFTKRRGQWLLRAALGAIGYFTRTRTGRAQPVSSSSDGHASGALVARILVVRVDLLGDVVLSLPAVHLLRKAYPEAEIDMLVQKSTAGVLEGQPGISRVLAYDPHIWRRPATYLWPANWLAALHLWREMRAARYDLAVSISGDLGSILTRLSGATRRFGYAGEAYPFFLTDPLPGGRYRTRQHETRYVLALAEAAGGILAGPGDATPQLTLVPSAEHQVDRSPGTSPIGTGEAWSRGAAAWWSA